MKRLISILFLSAANCFAAQFSSVTNVTLQWDYPTEELTTNLWFNVYHSTNIATPLTNWNRIASVQHTNPTPEVRLTVSITTPNFYSVTASNFWGESDFSEVLRLDAAPRSDIKLRIRRN